MQVAFKSQLMKNNLMEIITLSIPKFLKIALLQHQVK